MQNKMALDKGTPSSSRQGESASGRPKEKHAEAKEEDQGSKESEEEGELGEPQTSTRRSTRGRKFAREKREQETYKDKL
jgi:hypothetical protein